ncbi:ABC transporter permease [Microvirga massiliensis]|uniref:ABC transporter permease n=1 Tax=Microvirga massiliensis TaxID=1033741 RepID=UPI00062B9740|nr:iron export ABC transporter permease subunit FetB [Microvirga massiliensis]
MSAPLLSYADLAAAAVLVVLNAILSLLLNLGVARALLIAAARTVVQLLLVGLVLRTVFALDSPLLVAAVALAMLMAASYEIVSRQERRFAGAWGFGVGASTAMLATLFVTVFALVTLRPDPWFAPAVVIPLVGIVLGSVMNGVSISLNAFNTGVVRERAAIEARLALGADRSTALKPLQRAALRSGMIPIVNQMSAAGIITLPGMMTGQILAGMPPFEAAKYQILVLFLLAGASGSGALVATYVAVRRISDERDRLRLDRLAPA